MARDRLAGKVAVVTGVGSGLGQAIAREFAAEGARVFGCDVNDANGSQTMQTTGRYRHADVSNEADVAALVAEALTISGRLDIFVNNAAIQIEKELIETTEEDLNRIVAVNIKGVFFGCKHAVLAMRAGGGGTIVNIASILGLVGDGLLAAYCGSKGAVLGITRATAVQYAKDGIRCNAVCPGDIDTPLVQAYIETAENPAALRAEITGHYPVGRISSPVEIARTVVFLASDDASFMTGQPLVVDGGLLASCY
jgi:NAD(P)-dependent dehydrogenase (short-subunit alcohol dehydrogenase family)